MSANKLTNKHQNFDRKKALREHRAETRDGYVVVDLQESVLDGLTVLTGKRLKQKPPFPRNKILPYLLVYYPSGGLAPAGGLAPDGVDDLVNVY